MPAFLVGVLKPKAFLKNSLKDSSPVSVESGWRKKPGHSGYFSAVCKKWKELTRKDRNSGTKYRCTVSAQWILSKSLIFLFSIHVLRGFPLFYSMSSGIINYRTSSLTIRGEMVGTWPKEVWILRRDIRRNGAGPADGWSQSSCPSITISQVPGMNASCFSRGYGIHFFLHNAELPQNISKIHLKKFFSS